MKIVYVDFVRFTPTETDLFEGYDLIVPFNNDANSDIKGYLVKASNTSELQKKLKKAKGFVGVMSEDLKVNREAVMRRKVCVILDFEGRKIDYTTIKMAKDKDVIIEVSLSKFLRVKGLKRAKLLDETRLLLKLLLKFKTPFILTTGAENQLEVRPRKQLYRFFYFLSKDGGIDCVELIKLAKENSNRIFRKLVDKKYIMDGIEILDV